MGTAEAGVPAQASSPAGPARKLLTGTGQQQLDVGSRPEEIKQIEFIGETLDMASVLRWRNRIVPDGWRG
ncbi:hypothetical protein H6G65_03360 [Microcystis elabens FACHB-917]|nr:hypothetical protein [Microcystis elabens FACHB-917]